MPTIVVPSRHARKQSNSIPAGAELLEPRRLLSGFTFSTLATLPSTPSRGEIVADAKGDLFYLSTQILGGNSQQDAVFELAKGSKRPTVVVTFPVGLGADVNGLAIDSAGNLFGTDRSDGSNGQGTVWEIVKGTNSIFTLASFSQSITGSFPNQSHLVFDGSGDLFGTCESGGASNSGTIWELRTGTRSVTELASIPSSGITFGTSESGGLAIDKSGNLYGTIGADTSTNGAFGSVWELQFNTFQVNILASFDGTNGSDPQSPLVVDSNGNVFGTTTWGGTLSDGSHPITGDGTVFEIPNNTHTIITRAFFNRTNGSHPFGGLVADSIGNLFGVTDSAAIRSSTDGVVFELPKGGAATKTLFQLTATTGVQPGTELFIDTDGNLIDATELAVFQLTPAGNGGTGSGALTGVLSGKLPAAAISGRKVNISQNLVITDSGNGSVTGKVNAQLFLSTGTGIDSTSIRVGMAGKRVNLLQNGHFSLHFGIRSIAASIPLGTYRLVAQITDPSGKISEAASTGTINVVSAG